MKRYAYLFFCGLILNGGLCAADDEMVQKWAPLAFDFRSTEITFNEETLDPVFNSAKWGQWVSAMTACCFNNANELEFDVKLKASIELIITKSCNEALLITENTYKWMSSYDNFTRGFAKMRLRSKCGAVFGIAVVGGFAGYGMYTAYYKAKDLYDKHRLKQD